MNVEVRLAAGAVRGWHLDLAGQLDERPGVTAGIRLDGSRPERTPARQRSLLRTERIVHGLRPRRAALVGPDRLTGWLGRAGRTPDLVLAPEGCETPDGWRVTFDGRPGTAAAVASLAEGRFPLVEVRRNGTTLACGRPGSEQPGVVASALEDVLAGTVLLVEQAVAGNRLDTGAAPADPDRAVPRPRHSATRAAASAGLHRAYRAAYRAPHWRVGWRLLEDGEPDVLDLLDHPESGWRTLPDDGRHFYADPFPVAAGDHHVLFVEDYDHRLGRGVISAVEFDDDGPIGSPRPVLRHESHLSYPYVVEDEGEQWMIPETSGAGTVELYRAESFPDRWRREAVLLRDVTASDVSLVRAEDRWWMFATVRHGGSWSDALQLWSADRLTGPWRPHAGNPVLLDITSARPGGRPVWRSGRLLRPVQDGSAGYGGGLAIAEVTRLDDAGFDQRVIARLDPGEKWPGSRLHTLNRAGRLECIDGSARSPRFWR